MSIANLADNRREKEAKVGGFPRASELPGRSQARAGYFRPPPSKGGRSAGPNPLPPRDPQILWRSKTCHRPPPNVGTRTTAIEVPHTARGLVRGRTDLEYFK